MASSESESESAPPEPGPGPLAEPASRSHNLLLYAWLWAAFTLFHQGKPGFWARAPIEIAQTGAALLVLARPSLGRFLALVVLQAANLLYVMPEPTNHGTFALLVDLTVLAAALGLAVRERRVDAAALYHRFAPAVRVAVLVLYVIVTFHKLNLAFFDPTLSCAVDHYDLLRSRVASWLGIDLLPGGAWFRWVAIAGTILAEGGIPVLLALGRTRLLGVAVAIAFHFMLGVNNFQDFSAMAFALLALFLPDGAATELARAWRESRPGRWLAGLAARARGHFPAEPLLALALVAGLLWAGNSWRSLRDPVLALFAAHGVLVAAGFLVLRRRRRALAPLERPFALSPALAVFPVLVALNGLAPYLGLKTDSAFAMYSNLRTEGVYHNHFLVPRSLQAFGFQDDLVQVLDSTDRELRFLAAQRLLVPWYVVRDEVSRSRMTGGGRVRLRYVRNGVEENHPHAEGEGRLFRPYPWLLRKWMKFRPIDPAAPDECGH